MIARMSAEVARALDAGAAVVALESTLICHGFPRPDNLALAEEIEMAVRSAGAVPATTAVMEGDLKVGLTREELRLLASSANVVKCSARDLPVALVHGGLGATTVAATLAIAARAGIRVMATGGFGGVHRGGERSLDVSADLDQLARSPVAVVCSGAKSILDLPRTMERLETIGVTVVGFGCSELPGFYTTRTGLPVPRIDTVSNLCRLLEAQRNLGLPGAVVVAQPPPAELALDRTTADHLLRGAEEAACLAGIHGPSLTPFLLRWMAEQSAGATVKLNRALVLANARLAARVAVMLADPGATRNP